MKLKKKIPTTIKNPELVRKRHESLFQAALKLFSENGYHSTSVRQLSKESGIPLGTIYEYVGKKEDILLLVYQKVHEIFLEKTKESIAKRKT